MWVAGGSIPQRKRLAVPATLGRIWKASTLAAEEHTAREMHTPSSHLFRRNGTGAHATGFLHHGISAPLFCYRSRNSGRAPRGLAGWTAAAAIRSFFAILCVHPTEHMGRHGRGEQGSVLQSNSGRGISACRKQIGLFDSRARLCNALKHCERELAH